MTTWLPVVGLAIVAALVVVGALLFLYRGGLCQFGVHQARRADRSRFAARCARCGHWFVVNP